MGSSSQFTKFVGFALIIAIFVIGSLHSTTVDAVPAAQATMEGTVSAASCPTLNTTSMMSATPQSGMSTPTAMTSSGPGFLGVQIAAVDNCGVQVLQVFSGSAAAAVLQPNDVIVSVDCVALSDMISGSLATTSAGGTVNCMSSNATMTATVEAMTGVVKALSNPACMNTGFAGGTLHVTTLFFCIISQYHASNMVTLTLWRGGQQMNVAVVLDPAPVATPDQTTAATP